MKHGAVAVVAVVGLLSSSLAHGQSEPYAPRVGERHPDFTLPAIGDGRPVSLSEFRGKKVLLIQFAAW